MANHMALGWVFRGNFMLFLIRVSFYLLSQSKNIQMTLKSTETEIRTKDASGQQRKDNPNYNPENSVFKSKGKDTGEIDFKKLS